MKFEVGDWVWNPEAQACSIVEINGTLCKLQRLEGAALKNEWVEESKISLYRKAKIDWGKELKNND